MKNPPELFPSWQEPKRPDLTNYIAPGIIAAIAGLNAGLGNVPLAAALMANAAACAVAATPVRRSPTNDEYGYAIDQFMETFKALNIAQQTTNTPDNPQA